MMHTRQDRNQFYGWTVVRAAFVLAALGWGLGFYALPVFLGIIRESTGWPLGVVSAAVTAHFLVGALVAANLPAAHCRLGAARTTVGGAAALAAGLAGWAAAWAPWQLFGAALLSGIGWGALGASALNAFVTPWFNRERPAALGFAYNGASVGGIVLPPLWVAAIGSMGLLPAAVIIGGVALLVVHGLVKHVLRPDPAWMNLRPDGDMAQTATVPHRRPASTLPACGPRPWRDRRFATLCTGMALALFAQIGVTAHLFSLLVPVVGARDAALAISLMTLMAIAGRMVVAARMPPGADRRQVACASHGFQVIGCIALIASGGTDPWLLLGGVLLFGAGFGNATSLPPLIVQREFRAEDVQRITALAIGWAQGLYAFAPALFGLVREAASGHPQFAWLPASAVFAFAALLQLLAIASFLCGRSRPAHRPGRNPNTRSKRST
jgi:MFS family permease